METDRSSVIFARAAARGLIDFKQARFRDNRWWRKLNLITNELERELDQETYALDYHHQCTLLMVVASNLQAFSGELPKHLDGAHETYTRCLQVIRPWTRLHQKTKSDADRELSNAYKQNLGDPNDPEYKAQIDATIEEMKQRGTAVKQEQVEQEKRKQELIDRRAKIVQARRKRR